jgi:superfamily II DNA/RNA helicase
VTFQIVHITGMVLRYRLISSDALARGMDIEGVDYVVLYSAPKSVKNYIHRVGRTGRAGRPGTAVTFLLDGQVCTTEIKFGLLT